MNTSIFVLLSLVRCSSLHSPQHAVNYKIFLHIAPLKQKMVMECFLSTMKNPIEYTQMVHLTFSKTCILALDGQDTERCVHLPQIYW